MFGVNCSFRVGSEWWWSRRSSLGQTRCGESALPLAVSSSQTSRSSARTGLKEKNVKIDRIADHGVSLGVYFRDPDGNGLEISYELPREQWPREESIFAADMVNRGLFPGPWDADMAQERQRRTG